MGPGVALPMGMRRLALLLALLTASPALAGQRAGTHPGLYVATEIGIHDPNGSCYTPDLISGPALHAAAGWRLTRWAAIEGDWFRSGSRAKNYASPGSFAELEVTGRFYPWTFDRHRLEPNLIAGWAPDTHLTYGGKHLTGRSANAGAGFRFNSDGKFFFGVDVIHRFARYDRWSEGGESGHCRRELHGDGTAFLVGTGWQF
jgi:hypothetical protein